MHVQKGNLGYPKDEEGYHGVRGNTLVFGDVVWQCQEAWPYRSQHDTNSVGPILCLNRKPEDGKDGTRYDGDI